jgi:hypothetical protein
LLVPRASHTVTFPDGEISGINGLAFIGCLLIRDTDSIPVPSDVFDAITYPL